MHADAGRADAATDGAAMDGGTDTGRGDVGTSDTGTLDTGTLDTGAVDGGSDASCMNTTCGTACVDVQTDPHHCGACATDCGSLSHVDGTMATCSAGACVLTGACVTGFADCNGQVADGCEADLSQPATCGACGSACSGTTPVCGFDSTSGARICVGGCSGSTVRCGASCVDLTGDPMHCGSCAMACTDPLHGTATCVSSSCTPACDSGYHACSGACLSDGDVGSCGTSCTPCAVPPHATAHCTTGACGFDCIAPFADCNGSAADGCEVDTSSSASNCSACGATCAVPNASPACVGSACAVGTCNTGFEDCNAMASDGCETQTSSDPMNCSSCGAICNLPNATSTCVSSSCAIGSCAPGFMDCDGAAADGCERNLATDPNACGGCGNVCMLPNAVPACMGGMCAIAACMPGFSDCDGNPMNGCETNVGSNPNSCGMCGHVCNLPNATAGCSGGGCTVSACNAGFTDCNNLPGDGCEIHTAVSPLDCGFCGRQCAVPNGTPGCAAGSCTVASCNAGFADCNGGAANGCETNTTNDAGSCGTCGHSCAASCVGGGALSTCSASACHVISCSPNRYDIDGVCADGCECTSSGTGSICAAPTSVGTLNIGVSTSYTGNLVPAGQEAYLTVTFQGNGSPAYHPHIVMTAGAAEFAFDVLTDCGGGLLSCGAEGGTSSNRTDWEVLYTAGDSSSASFSPIPAVGAGGVVLVHVYRRTGLPVSCNTYRLSFAN